MKIIEPSAQIIEDELAQLSIYQRIAYCAGVCYQREPRKTEEEAQAFCKKMVEIGHYSTLEMAVVHLVFDWENFSSTAIRNNHYIKVTTGENPYEYVLSGSVRALLEATGYVADDIRRWLGSNDLSLFFKCEPRKYTTFDIRFAPPHEIPWQHQHVAVRFIVNRAVSHELVRHRPMSFLQECLSGDTEVRSFSGKKSWTMERLYEMFNTSNCGLAKSKIRIRTKTKDGEIVPSKIKAVFKSGIKNLYKVTTKNGYSIKTSENHIFFTETGERRLKDINIGDRVFLNGRDVSPEWVRREYLMKNRKRADIAAEIGMSDAWLGKKIASWGLTKPKKNYPGRKPGRGVKGMHSDEEKKRISVRMSGSNNHRWLGDDVSINGSRSRLHRADLAVGKQCQCGKPAREIHHIDRDPRNNAPENLEYVCTKCHKARHYATGVQISWLDEIISIEPCGTEMTYDLEVDRPEHNFSANGFFVHNSQRYCRYDDEVVFIRPEWCSRDWTADRQSEVFHYTSEIADTQYKILLANGLKPQQARAVLPNSTKTELIAYAPLPQWKHIFKLRCSPAADPEMRRVMIPLEAQFKEKYPEAFNEQDH